MRYLVGTMHLTRSPQLQRSRCRIGVLPFFFFFVSVFFVFFFPIWFPFCSLTVNDIRLFSRWGAARVVYFSAGHRQVRDTTRWGPSQERERKQKYIFKINFENNTGKVKRIFSFSRSQVNETRRSNIKKLKFDMKTNAQLVKRYFFSPLFDVLSWFFC